MEMNHGAQRLGVPEGMVERLSAHDWSKSSLGPTAGWPKSLKSICSLMLHSKFPMFVAWGSELSMLYNDAYAAILGAKHPAAMGMPFKQVWHEIWAELEPLVQRSLLGEASWLEDLPLKMNRHGFEEQTWFTFSYSPAFDDQGGVGGLFCACTETTEKVLAIRSNKVERERLEQLFEQAPGFMAMVSSPDHVFELTNQAYTRLVGDRNLIGKRARDALPELEGQGFFELLDEVYRSGEPFVGRRLPLQLKRTANGPLEAAYVDFIYQPIKDSAGTVTGIFAEGHDVTEQSLTEKRLEQHAQTLETLNQTGAALAAELDLDKVVQRVTDAGTSLTGAQFGAFFYTIADDHGESFTLFSLAGASRDKFEQFGHPRATEVFRPTFDGTETVRSDDITQDVRYGKNDPHFGLPANHLPVRSYLAVPVKSRSGQVLGGLFFGHEECGIFSAAHEELIQAIASQAAVAIDNARLYREAHQEISQRKNAERHQRLLINELNHRVKNTLAIVQGLAHQSFKADKPTDVARASFDARLRALASAHNLLTRASWEQASLDEIIQNSVGAATGDAAARVTVDGPNLLLAPQTAVSLAMAIHELSTNAIKYGALSNGSGTVSIVWRITEESDARRLHLEWTEAGGPVVEAPARRGFGSRMIERGLAAELRGTATLVFEPTGLRCVLDTPVPEVDKRV